MKITADHLYSLLPSVYRIRDAEGGGALRALVEVLAEQGGVMEENIARLYENWFIETCEEWVVPYIGDLLSARNLYEVNRLHSIDEGVVFSRRARAANTIRYRRRKGTVTMLEQLARDTTGWNARAVEFFTLLGWTQNMNHFRMEGHRTADLRDTEGLELLESPFGTNARTVDVRRIASGRGTYNIANVGIFLWRLSSYFLHRSEPRPAAAMADGRYRFNPVGTDIPLFNRPQTETEITHLAEEVNVPGELRRRPLYDELEGARQSLAEGGTADYLYFGTDPVVRVFVRPNPGDSMEEIPPEEILICNLADPPAPIPEGWRRPPTAKDYTLPDGSVVQMPVQVAVDPALGRIAFPDGVVPDRVEVSCAVGFSGDVGGGAYDRRDSVDAALEREVEWQAGVAKELPGGDGLFFTTLSAAVTAWNAWSAANPGKVGVIAVADNGTYREDLTGSTRVEIPEGSFLMITSARWPEEGDPPTRMPGRLEPNELRAHLLGNLSVLGTAPNASLAPGTLVIDGLLMEGTVRVLSGNLGRLRLSHSTVVPGIGEVTATSGNRDLGIELVRTICGRIALDAAVLSLRIEESIINGKIVGDAPVAVAAAQTAVSLVRSTLLGSVSALRIDADSTIVTGLITAARRQQGCVRFSYILPGSVVPRRYRCQPDLALSERARELGLQSTSELTEDERELIRFRLTPLFTSTRYGDPGYGQLGRSCAEEIRTGGENGAEMGAFNFLLQPQREANLRASLSDYLRFGLEAGIIFTT